VGARTIRAVWPLSRAFGTSAHASLGSLKGYLIDVVELVVAQTGRKDEAGGFVPYVKGLGAVGPGDELFASYIQLKETGGIHDGKEWGNLPLVPSVRRERRVGAAPVTFGPLPAGQRTIEALG
jgi:hypothetical protein